MLARTEDALAPLGLGRLWLSERRDIWCLLDVDGVTPLANRRNLVGRAAPSLDAIVAQPAGAKQNGGPVRAAVLKRAEI